MSMWTIILTLFYATDSIQATIYDVHGRNEEALDGFRRSTLCLILIAINLLLNIIKSLFL